MHLIKVYRLLIIVMSIWTIHCRTEQPKSMSQIQRELFDERCGLRKCSESKKDGYYRYAGFPVYYYKEKELPKYYRYRVRVYYNRYPASPYGYRLPPYGR